MKKIISCVFIILLFVAITAFGMDINGTYMTLKAPAAVPRGEPFVVNIESSLNVKKIQLTIDDKSFTVPTTCNDFLCFTELLLPMPYENPATQTVSLLGLTDDNLTVYDNKTVALIYKEYRLQKLTVDAKYVTPPESVLKRIEKERIMVLDVLNSYSSNKMWQLPFKKPTPGEITTEFGARREFNGEPRRSHYGIDFRGKSGDNIYAVADGMVVLTGEHYFGGNSIFIDHGEGVVSYYMHMSKMLVKKGDTVKEGDIIGLIGATGRVTGPHLHFGLSVLGYPVDVVPLFNYKKTEMD